MLLDHLQIAFWTSAYILIAYYGWRYRKEHILLMPMLAGVMNFAWEINALLISRGNYGHILWTGLDIAIFLHNLRRLPGKKQRVYYGGALLGFIGLLYGIFHIFTGYGQLISVFIIDLIMSLEFVLLGKVIAPQGKILIGSLRLLGDLFAWLFYLRQSTLVGILGGLVLLLNLFYLAYCLEQRSILGRRQRKR